MTMELMSTVTPLSLPTLACFLPPSPTSALHTVEPEASFHKLLILPQPGQALPQWPWEPGTMERDQPTAPTISTVAKFKANPSSL